MRTLEAHTRLRKSPTLTLVGHQFSTVSCPVVLGDLESIIVSDVVLMKRRIFGGSTPNETKAIRNCEDVYTGRKLSIFD